MIKLVNISVSDRFGVTNDPNMPFLAKAIDPLEVQPQLQLLLSHESELIQLEAIRVTRYKPRRRCLIEYDLKLERFDARVENITLVGKTRSRGLDWSSYNLAKSLWNRGFGANSEDRIFVPEPIGVIPEFQMWLQRKVPGELTTKLLTEEKGIELAQRIAQAIHKVHQAAIPTSRHHTITDELRILHERLPLVAKIKPQWTKRLEKILDGCDREVARVRDRLGANISESHLRGIHRDFYPDQVITDGESLYLLDFDLYCEGNPALDIGNFIAHIQEQSLRTLGNIDALKDRENALVEEFLKLANGATTMTDISTYTTLTLVRHIYISTLFPERCPFTHILLEICEERLLY